MNRLFRRKTQAGVAAVELAIVLPLLVTLLLVPLFFGRYFMYYTAAQKAAQNAARYMAMVRLNEIRSPVLLAAVTGQAKQIARATLDELQADGQAAYVDIDCDKEMCTGGNVAPTTVSVIVTLRVSDWFGLVDTGQYGLDVKGDARFNYTGN